MTTLIKSNGNNNNLMFPKFPSLFDDFVTRDLFQFPLKTMLNESANPAVNIKETQKDYQLEMAVPGMEKKDFKVEIENGILHVSAQHETKSEEKSKEGNYVMREFSYQSFERTFELPEELVNDDDIRANYKNGILHVVIPKKENASAKVSKLISIN